MKKTDSIQPLQKKRDCAILSMQNQAIICPNCRRKIRGVRVQQGGMMRKVSIKCRDCGAEIIVDIDQASATYTSPRR